MQRTFLAYTCGVVAVLVLLAGVLYPLVAIVGRSVDSPGALLALAADPYVRERLAFSAFLAALSTLLTVVVALPGALLFGRYDFRGKRLLRSAFTIPFVMPSIVAGIGFLALVGPRGLLGVNLYGTLVLVLLAHVFYNYAIVVRIVGAYLERAAPRLQEAAQSLGASPVRLLVRVTLPLAAPALTAAALLVFVFSFTSFGVILVLAPQPAFATAEVAIYRLTVRLLELDAAAALALAQLAVVLVFTLLYTRLQARLSVPLAGARPPLPRATGGARVLLGLHLAGAFVLVLAPLAALLFATLSDPRSLAYLAETPRSLRYPGAAAVVWNSLRFAFASTAVALVAGFAFAYAVARGGWRFLDVLSLLPLATSAVTLGFGYLLAYPQLAGTAPGLVLAHALIAFPFVTRSLLPALRGLPANLPAAATTLGASPLGVLRRVELPLLGASFLTAASFAFAISMGEFGATLVLARPEHATLPVAIYDRLARPGLASYGAALTLSTLLMAVTAAVMLTLERFGRSEW